MDSPYKKWIKLNEHLFTLGLTKKPAIGEIIKDDNRGLPSNEHCDDEDDAEEGNDDDGEEEEAADDEGGDDSEDMKFMKKKKKVKKMSSEKKKKKMDVEVEDDDDEEEEDGKEDGEEEIEVKKKGPCDNDEGEEDGDDDKADYGFMKKDKKGKKKDKKCKCEKHMMKDHTSHDEFVADLKSYMNTPKRPELNDAEFINSLSAFKLFTPVPVQEDFLISPESGNLASSSEEPQPGDVGFAPQQKIGDAPVANFAESNDYEVLCKYFDSDFAMGLIKKMQRQS